MNIKDLQKLDFLLKRVNDSTKSENFKLVVGLNGNSYVADFVPKVERVGNTNEYKIIFKSITSIENDVTDHVVLSDLEEWNKLTREKANVSQSYIDVLVSKSNYLKSCDYLTLLIDVMNKVSINFEKDLPFNLYNIKKLDGQLPISFIRIEENVEFDYVSLIPEQLL